MQVSVIVPMYNVENYIKECLDSLVNQTLKDMEVIVVNDGSTDGGVEIVESYCKKYPDLIRLVHKENGGLSDARNYGIPYAKGKYIGFLDSDDYVESTMYEKMSKKLDEGYDVVVCDIEYFYEDSDNKWILKGLSDWNIENISKRALLSPMFAWNKLYKAKYFKEENYRYPLNTWYEDLPVTTLIFAKTDKIGHVNEALVHYRQREGSIMSATRSKRLFEIFNVMKMVRDNFKKQNLYDEYKDELEYLHIEHLRLYGMFRFIRSSLFKDLYKESDKTMNTYYPNWKDNKYINNLSLKNIVFLKYFNLTTNVIFKLFIK
jgi:glycosyltransferase involved in cell wall biosynthesis